LGYNRMRASTPEVAREACIELRLPS